MAPRAKKIIRLKVETIAPDPNQYKPWSPILRPENLYLCVPISKEEIVIETVEGEEKILIGLDGFKALLKEIGIKLYELNEEFTTEVRKSKVVSKKK